MNISLRTFAFNPYHVVKKAVTESLTPLQQKVAWIALAVIASVCVGVFVFRRYPFKRDHTPSGAISKLPQPQPTFPPAAPLAKTRNVPLDPPHSGHGSDTTHLLDPKRQASSHSKAWEAVVASSVQDGSLEQAEEAAPFTPPPSFQPVVQPSSEIASASVIPNILPSSETLRSEITQLGSFMAPHVNKDVTSGGKMSIPERLAKNADWALKAQNQERQEGGQPFEIETFDRKTSVEINRILDSSGQLFCGVASAKSYKHSMQEDAHILVPNFEVEGVTGGAELFGVFDGHGGTGASTFVRENIFFCFQTALQEVKKAEGTGVTDEVVWKTLKLCCILVQAAYNGRIDGTTAVIAVTLNGKVWIANVGDSRAILVKENGETVQASEDANPKIARYRKKIEEKGGIVRGRFVLGVDGSVLAVARAIGDWRFPGVSSIPKITCYSLNDFPAGYLVLASDGLYDRATTDAVGTAVHLLAGKGWSPDKIAERLVRAAIGHQSSDDVTVLVVKLPAAT